MNRRAGRIRSEAASSRRAGAGFTLIELLVVMGIIALLIGILLPALRSARETARATVCGTNLRTVGQGLVLYNDDYQELVIPSYNMTGINGGPDVPLDGWAPILDRDGYMKGHLEGRGNPFYCPATVDVEGAASGQTGSNPDNPKGWMDWPFTRNGTANVPVTIPERGFERIIRVGYWINADNPIGGVVSVTPDVFYTSSVGYGPGSNGLHLRQTRLSAFVRPYQLISIADGLYAGRQRDNQQGMNNSRIGFRHPGRRGAANVVFGDGHVDALAGKEFPRSLGGSNNPEDIRRENLNGRPSVYANPERSLLP